jgi:hypothetical protein
VVSKNGVKVAWVSKRAGSRETIDSDGLDTAGSERAGRYPYINLEQSCPKSNSI